LLKPVSTPAGRRVPNADTAGAVGSLQVARRAGPAFGGFPAANIGSSSVAPVLRRPARQHKPRNGPCPHHLENRRAAQ
jgi:hypothetical protein